MAGHRMLEEAGTVGCPRRLTSTYYNNLRRSFGSRPPARRRIHSAVRRRGIVAWALLDGTNRDGCLAGVERPAGGRHPPRPRSRPAEVGVRRPGTCVLCRRRAVRMAPRRASERATGARSASGRHAKICWSAAAASSRGTSTPRAGWADGEEAITRPLEAVPALPARVAPSCPEAPARRRQQASPRRKASRRQRGLSGGRHLSGALRPIRRSRRAACR